MHAEWTIGIFWNRRTVASEPEQKFSLLRVQYLRLCLLTSLHFLCVPSLVRGSEVKAMEEKERKRDETR
jgi:hypothetical protein